MTSGGRTERIFGLCRSILFACVLLSAPWLLVQAASPAKVDLADLMHELSEVRAAQGRFTERKYISILREPLVLEGRVRYRAPDYVRKEYDDPNGESYEVRGDHLTIEFADGRRRDLSIDEHPVLRAFVESYRGTLAGDLETLQSYFDIELAGRMEDWMLRLIPRRKDLAEYLSEVVMLGRGSTVYSIETLEASGDRSVMTVESSGE